MISVKHIIIHTNLNRIHSLQCKVDKSAQNQFGPLCSVCSEATSVRALVAKLSNGQNRVNRFITLRKMVSLRVVGEISRISYVKLIKCFI